MEDRWKNKTSDSALLKRFPYLLDPLGGLLDKHKNHDQLQVFVELLFGVELSQEQLDLLWEEADLDGDQSISFAEAT